MSTGGDSTGSTFAYAAPFPDSPYPDERQLERYRELFEPAKPPPPLQILHVPPLPLTEVDMRRIIREELQRMGGVDQDFCSWLRDQRAGHLLDEHPMEDPPGAD